MWWVNFKPPIGRRPAVLVSRDEAYDVRSRVAVVPLTRTQRAIPTQLPLGPEDGVPRPSAASADDITTVPRRVITDYLCTLGTAKVTLLDQAIKFALDLR